MTTRNYLPTLPLILGVLLTLALLWSIDGLLTNAAVSPPGTGLAKRPLSIVIPARHVAATGADETDLIVVKQANPDPVQAGAQLTYTIRVTNASDADLHVVITDTLPLSITPGQTAIIPGGQITWAANISAPHGVWTQAFVVTVAERYDGLLTNVVRVAAVKGATGVYTETSTVFIPRLVYLPIILRDTPGITTLVGEYLLVGNPCTIDRCPPGVVYAVSVDGTHYYLTVEGDWLRWNRPWNGYTPQVGELVTVDGYVDDMVDIFGAPFDNIEVVSLEPAPAPPTATWNIAITGVHLDDEYVEIFNNDDAQPVQLNGWTLRNAGSQRVFTFPDFLMQPGQVCRVYTNEDHPEWCGFSFGSETAIWDYVQDCAYLWDGEGTLVDTHCYCQSHTSHMTIAATAATLQVGKTVTVTATLFNDGCVGLGIPQYRLYVRSDEPGPVFSPDAPEPAGHYPGEGPGPSDGAGSR